MDWFPIQSLATSYPPGHDFWSGTPLHWVLRGTVAFGLVVGPSVVVGLILIWRTRRYDRSWRMIPLPAYFAIVWFWSAMMRSGLRDGDRPWYLGMRWGLEAMVPLVCIIVVMVFVPRTTARRLTHGFRVETK